MMTEDKALLSIGWVPIDHAHIFSSGHLANQSLGDINSVVETRAGELIRVQQAAGDLCCDQRCFKVASQDRFGISFGFQISAGEEAECPSERMFTYRQSVEFIRFDFTHRSLGRQ